MKTTKPLFKQLHESQQMVKKQELTILELESDILALKELFEKVLRDHIALTELRDFYRNKISEL